MATQHPLSRAPAQRQRIEVRRMAVSTGAYPVRSENGERTPHLPETFFFCYGRLSVVTRAA
jgi:hypothetical protein